MSVSIGNNNNSLFIQNKNNDVKTRLDKTFEQLASGRRINQASDDAAGLAIATRLQSQETGFNTAARNANDGVSLSQVAEGGLQSVNDNLQRIRELSVQAANATLGNSERKALNEEAQSLKDEISRVVETTEFGGVKVLSQNDTLDFQVGAQANQTISLETKDLRDSLSSLDNLDLSTAAGAQTAIATTDSAISSVVDQSAEFGAVQNRFESAISSLGKAAENTAQARSRIQDTDFAAATANLTRDSILNQAGLALQKQANQDARVVASLLS